MYYYNTMQHNIIQCVVFHSLEVVATIVKNRGSFWMILINPYENNGETLKPTYKKSGQIITTSAEVTLNGGLVREIPPKSP